MTRKTCFPLFLLLASVSFAAAPVVRVLEPGSQSTTDAATVTLKGVAAANSPLASIYWINQEGMRGQAQWIAGGLVQWTADVPLRPGGNHITVLAVDSGNHAGAAQLSVRSNAAPGPQPSAIRSGFWHGLPVTYAVVNGMAIVEGDIILGPADQMAAAPRGVHTDGFTDSYTALLWPLANGVHQIPYTIQSGSPNLTAAINYVNSALSGMIQFVPQTTETNYVTFDFDPANLSGSCESNVGMTGGQQFIQGSVNCTVATLAHEMGHTIGLLHEHQRPDRNSYVTFTPANADKPLIAGNLDFFTSNYQVVGLYDYASVMHYGAFTFTKNNLPVLESIPAGIPLSNPIGYSPGDIDQIQRLYGYTPSSVTIATNPAGLQFIADGVTYTAPQTFAWAMNSKHQLSLPADPQLTNPADGSTYEFARWNDGGARAHTISVGGGSGLLTSPYTKPAVTVYEVNFIRLQPFGDSVYPSGAGTVSVSPAPQSIFGGSFFVDRQKITLSAVKNAGENFYGWFFTPYPQSSNPYPLPIQSPLTNAQAGFTTSPVTIVGESITGPNTWNPPLYAYVDGLFTDLPQGFTVDYSGSNWAAGTSHTVDAPSPDYPVTTNVGYSWNAWSDGGAQTHTIQASSAGVLRVIGSWTPVYRSYAYSQETCGGTVAYSPSCPGNDCSFPDSTSVTMTATPVEGSGMVFAAWTGDLTGIANPQTTTIHDEFLPVANFNVVPAIITVKSVTPAQPVETPNALNLTVNGTGFVNGDLFTYWNGGYRGNTFGSSTLTTVHLNAGDAAVAGGQSLQVSNFTSSCGASAFTQVLVKATYGTARLSIAKTHQGNFTHGETNAAYTVTASNAATATGPTRGKVTVSDTVPTGLTLVSMAGAGWTCTGTTCSRTDTLSPGQSYAAITVTVNVASNAPPGVTNTVTVSGGDSPSASAADPTTIN